MIGPDAVLIDDKGVQGTSGHVRIFEEVPVLGNARTRLSCWRVAGNEEARMTATKGQLTTADLLVLLHWVGEATIIADGRLPQTFRQTLPDPRHQTLGSVGGRWPLRANSNVQSIIR